MTDEQRAWELLIKIDPTVQLPTCAESWKREAMEIILAHDRETAALAERLRDAVIKAAIIFCQKTQEDMDALDGTCSLDIPIEFMELQYAVRDLLAVSRR